MSEAVVRAPNSILLIGDPTGQPPASLSGGLVAATTSCIAVRTLSSDDGATRVHFAKPGEDHPAQLVFDGRIKLGSGVLTVQDVYGRTILERVATGRETDIQIWVNHPSEPDEIAIVVPEPVQRPSRLD
jgi:hypothetical protein